MIQAALGTEPVRPSTAQNPAATPSAAQSAITAAVQRILGESIGGGVVTARPCPFCRRFATRE